MKTILPTLCIFFSVTAAGQITTPIVKANFGIDADLKSNFFNGAPQPAYDDWYSNSHPGTGEFVIDTAGSAAIVAGYTTNPATRSRSFSRLMRQAPYSTVNNRLLIDAIFHRDFHGTDSTVFASGSNKNGMSPALWTCPAAQGIPDKNDILDAYVHVRRAGPNVIDSMWMFSAISLENTSGSRYFDFELYQTDIYYDRTTRQFRNYGPDAGHTSWKFDAAGNITAVGDIIFTAEFGSSSLTNIEARIWINRASLSTTPATFNWGGQFDGDGTGATFGYASIRPKTTGAFYTGLPCVANTWAGPFNLIRDDNSMVTTYLANQFLEFSVNLTKLGLDPRQTVHNACGTPFRRVLIKSRASTSFTAELKDFIAPFRMFDFPLVDASTFLTYFCEVFPQTTITVQNPLPPSVYTWTTSNGHIVGAATGTSITVDAPGTYYVSQQLHIQCPVYSSDSMTLFFDPVCTVLDVNFLELKATRMDNQVRLKWQVNNNRYIAEFEIEYSTDNSLYYPLPVTVTAKDIQNNADYLFDYPLPLVHAENIYYRVKAIGKSHASKLSNTVRLENPVEQNPALPGIFPNPTTGKFWISPTLAGAAEAQLSIWNSNGELIGKTLLSFKTSTNAVAEDMLTGKPKGIYFIKIISTGKVITRKIVLN